MRHVAPTPLAFVDHPARAWRGTGGLDGPARRIVSLLPSATEIVCALGLADRLVAVTHECDYPPATVASLPRVTANRIGPEVQGSRAIDAAVRTAVSDGHGLYALDTAALDELAPDVILTQELCSVCAVAYPTVLQAARAAGGDAGPVVISLEPSSIGDVLATIRLVARLAGVGDRGARLTAALRRRLAIEPSPGGRRRVALVEWLDPLFAPGHWVPEQVALAGGISVIGHARERSRELEWEALADADPEVVVLALCGFDLGATLQEWDRFHAPSPLRGTAAWRAGEVWAIDGSAFVSRPGPRLVDGVEIMASILAGRPDERAVLLPT